MNMGSRLLLRLLAHMVPLYLLVFSFPYLVSVTGGRSFVYIEWVVSFAWFTLGVLFYLFILVCLAPH